MPIDLNTIKLKLVARKYGRSTLTPPKFTFVNDDKMAIVSDEIYQAAWEEHETKLQSCARSSNEGFMCTRETGHSGPHMAIGGTKAYHIWDYVE